MKANMSIQEGVIRLFLGMIIAAVGGAFMNPVGFLALPFIVTALGGWCPLYAAFKIYTNEECPYEDHTHAPKPEKKIEKKVNYVNS